MQTKETSKDGLKRGYEITITADDIAARIEAEVAKIAPKVQMPGFRPGKVPANLVRKMHGEALHGQTVNDMIGESVDSLMRDEKLRPAMQPRIDLGEGYEEGKDALITVELEILPEVPEIAIDDLALERLTVPITDEQVDEALKNIAEGQKSYKDAPKTKKAADGDQLIIDFVGKLDGEEFEGGKAEDAPLVLGSGQFIPGFEEQLIGVKTGDEKTITVTFPENYQAENLKGKEATFDVTVKAVKVEDETKIDDEFAKGLGLEGLEQLQELVRGQIEQELNGLTRTQMKRSLLDQLAAKADFAVPEGMVEAEFDQIWQQLQREAASEDDPAEALKEIEADKDEYRDIAVRRVRLGLMLSEIGQQNGVEVSPQEMNMLIQQAAQQYRPEDRERFFQFIQQDPMAAAQIRAPLYEDKVVDFLFDKADISEREVSREELEAAIEAEEADEEKAAKPKKAAAKKAPAKKAPAKKSAAKKPAAKKADDNADDKADKAEKKPAAKKAAPKKAPAKKAAAKKPAAKKAATKKAAAKE